MPRSCSARRTRLAVAREVAASAAMSFCVSGDRSSRRGPAVEIGQLENSTEHTGLRRHEDCFEQSVAGPANALCEQVDEDLVHLRVLATESLEVVSGDRERLAGFDCRDGRRAGHRIDQGELAEGRAGTVDRDHDAVSVLCDDTCGEVPLHDEVKAVGGVPAVKDDFAAAERASASERHEPSKLGLRQGGKELRVDHGRTVTVVTLGVSRLRRRWKCAEPWLVSWV